MSEREEFEFRNIEGRFSFSSAEQCARSEEGGSGGSFLSHFSPSSSPREIGPTASFVLSSAEAVASAAQARSNQVVYRRGCENPA